MHKFRAIDRLYEQQQSMSSGANIPRDPSTTALPQHYRMFSPVSTFVAWKPKTTLTQTPRLSILSDLEQNVVRRCQDHAALLFSAGSRWGIYSTRSTRHRLFDLPVLSSLHLFVFDDELASGHVNNTVEIGRHHIHSISRLSISD